MYFEKIIHNDWTVVTLPSSPGPLNEDLSNFEVIPYMLTFEPSVGIVELYKVILETNSSQHSYSVKSPVVVTSDLKPDTQYTYSITAYNKLDNQSETVSGIFRTKNELHYGVVCSSIKRFCQTSDFICRHDKLFTLRCLCPDDSYYSNNICKKDPGHNVTLVAGTSEVNLTLTQFHKHRITWSTVHYNDFQSIELTNSSQNSILLTNLTPGQEYLMSIYFYLAPDMFHRERIFRSNLTFFTLPATPGQLIENESELRVHPIIFKFKPSNGLVKYYNVTFKSSNSSLYQSTNISSLLTYDLTFNQLYNYTITAYDRFGKASETVTGEMKTDTKTHIKYSDSCNQTYDICKYSNMVCKYDRYGQSRCLCLNSYIYDNGKCVPAITLNSVTKIISATNLTLSVQGPFLRHSVTWSSSSGLQGVIHNFTGKTVHITDLMESTSYTLHITSTAPADMYNTEQHVYMKIDVRTRPLPPGAIIESESNFQTPPYRLKFLPAGRHDQYYVVFLKNEKCEHSNTLYKPEYTTSSLCTDAVYNYTIYAANTDSIYSEPTTGKFKTGKVIDTKHGMPCNRTNVDECESPDLICRNDKTGQLKCLCPDGTVNKDNKCLSDLKISHEVGKSEINLTLENFFLFHKHRVTWSILESAKSNIIDVTNSTKKLVTLSHLISGQEYFLRIESYIAPDVNYYERICVSKIKINTLPSAPGAVLENESELRVPPYVIKFEPSAGLVAYYNITLSSSNSSFSYIINVTRITAAKLTPNTVYSYSIVAYNKLGNASEAVNGTIRTANESVVKYGSICEQHQDICKLKSFSCTNDTLGQLRCLCGNNLLYADSCLSGDNTWSVNARNDSTIELKHTTSYLVRYCSVRWSNSKGMSGVIHNVTGQSIVVSGLAPGVLYTIHIISTYPADQYTSEKYFLSVLTANTRLPKVENIVENECNFQKPPYRLKFFPSEGNINYYKISIDGLDVLTTNIADYTIQNLVDWIEHTYQIIATNREGYDSNPTRGAFKIGKDTRYGQSCNKTAMLECQAPNLICRTDLKNESKCLCPDGLLTKDYKCLSDLKVDFQTVRDGVKVNLSSDTPDLAHNVTWSVHGYYLDIKQIHAEKSNDVIIVSGLTHGEEYVFRVYSFLPADNFTHEKVVQSLYTTVMFPAIPGKIMESDSNLRTSPYTLRFTPSEGIVQYYNVTFQSQNSPVNYTVTLPEVITSDLISNTEYNYSITAYNKWNNASLPVFGSIRIF